MIYKVVISCKKDGVFIFTGVIENKTDFALYKINITDNELECFYEYFENEAEIFSELNNQARRIIDYLVVSWDISYLADKNNYSINCYKEENEKWNLLTEELAMQIVGVDIVTNITKKMQVI